MFMKKEKVKQLDTVDMSKLLAIADDDGVKDIGLIYLWIIKKSPYWRAKGYDEIVKEINQINSVSISK